MRIAYNESSWPVYAESDDKRLRVTLSEVREFASKQAAAPDLYEALRSVIAHWDEFGTEHGLDETIHYARAALSKASQQQGSPQS